jgi:acetolactate synthase-1/2/3 large subunit
LGRLLEVAETMDRPGWIARARSLVAAWHTEVAPFAVSDATPLRPERLCREIAQWLPPDGIVVSDTGHSAQWSGSLLALTRPGQRYIRCAGTLGWGLPGAIGVQCALPDRPVVLLTGDGGLYYHLSELETAARLGIRLIVIVNNNGSLSQVRRGFDAAYGGRQRGRAEEMWRYRPVRFDRIAEEMGCLGIRVEQPGEVGPALACAAASGRPAVIDVATDLYAIPLAPWRKEA